MLFFAQRPDVAFHKIVLWGLEVTHDHLKEEYMEDDDVMSVFYEQTKQLFSRKELLSQVSKLLISHKSNKLFRITDYHFLILHDIIFQTAELHNEHIQEGESLFGELQIKNIDFEMISEIFFWDEDFLISNDIFDNLAWEAKDRLGISDEVFSITHGLKPHPSELEIKIMDIPKNWEALEVYKRGEDYPFLNE